MMRTLVRSPLLHFLVLGTAVYVAQGFYGEDAGGAYDRTAREITIPPARVDELQTRFTEQMGRVPDDAETDRMITAEVEEEILFREAVARGLLERDGGVQTRLIQKMLFLEGRATLDDAPALLARAVALGLHQDDIVVRRILVQKMRLLGGRLAADQAVSEADVERAYAERREVLRAPDRLSLTHVFVSRDRWGEATLDTARSVLDALVDASVPQAAGPERGDPFPLGHHLARRSRHDLERTFGSSFGESGFARSAPAAGHWTGPIPSAYGAHLVLVESVKPGVVPPLATVANRLRLEIEEERREANLEALLSDLRSLYRVRRDDVPTRATDIDANDDRDARGQETG